MPAPAFLPRPFLLALAAVCLALAPQAAISQGAAKDEEITVTGMAPNPIVGNGAPLFSLEDLAKTLDQANEAARYNKRATDALIDCRPPLVPETESDRNQIRPYERGFKAAARLISATQEAQRTTAETNDLRRRVPLGQATQAELEASELKRQDAVNKMIAAKADDDAAKAALAFVQELERDGVPNHLWDSRLATEELRWAKNKARNNDDANVVTESVSVNAGQDRKGAFLKITGQMRNTSEQSVSIPQLSFTAFDEQGGALLTQVARGRGKIASGKATPFAFEMRPAPQRSQAVEVTVGGFSPPSLMSAPPVCFTPPNSLGGRSPLITSAGRPNLANEAPNTTISTGR